MDKPNKGVGAKKPTIKQGRVWEMAWGKWDSYKLERTKGFLVHPVYSFQMDWPRKKGLKSDSTEENPGIALWCYRDIWGTQL